MNMTKDYNPKEYRRNNNKGIKAIALLLALIVILIFDMGTASAAVDGITKNNYMDYVKPIPDEYGFNIGECKRDYLEGEEYFYNDYIDHWNVDKVYSAEAIPTDWNKATDATTTEVKATTTTTKKAVAKKAKKKSKKAKAKKKNKKKGKKSKKNK